MSMCASIAEILTAKGLIAVTPQAARAAEDARWRAAGATARCTVTSRTGKEARTIYGITEDAAYAEAEAYAFRQGWNIPACRFATYRLCGDSGAQ